MREIKLMGKKDFDFNMKSLDQELKDGSITKEEAYDSRNKITEAFKSGDNNKRLEQLKREYPEKYKLVETL